jgi:hypothetical protein
VAISTHYSEPPRDWRRLHFLRAVVRDGAPTPGAKKPSRRGDVR